MKHILLGLFCIFSIYVKSQTFLITENFTDVDSLKPTGNPAWTNDPNLAVSPDSAIRNRVITGTSASLTTLTFSTAAFSKVYLEFSQICKTNVGDTARVQYSINNGVTWITLPASTYIGTGASYATRLRFSANSYPTLWQNTCALCTPTNAWWQKEKFDMSAILANQDSVKLRFNIKVGANVGGGNYGWLLDDIKVYAGNGELNPPVITLTAPIVQGTLINALGPYAVKATITDDTGIDSAIVYYTKNGGAQQAVKMTKVTGNNYEAFIPSMAVNDLVCYYVWAIDSSLSHNIAINPSSNCISFFIGDAANAIIGIPYFDDFETSNSWKDSTILSTTKWELGLPTTSPTNKARGLKCWDINLTTQYTNSAKAYLTSPRFDLSTVKNPTIEFYHNRAVSAGGDGYYVEYSVDNGQTWQLVGNNTAGNIYGTNWYNAMNINPNKQGWSGTSSGSWVKSSYLLQSIAKSAALVRFRFVFESNTTANGVGVSIDDIRIFDNEVHDVGIDTILNPGPGCTSNANPFIKAIVKNYGRTNVEGIFNFSYKINVGTPVFDPLTVLIPVGGTDTITFVTPLALANGTYDFTVRSELDSDYVQSNNASSVTSTLTSPITVPYLNRFEVASSINAFCNQLKGTDARVQILKEAGNASNFGLAIDGTNSGNWTPDVIPDSTVAWDMTKNPKNRYNTRLVVQTQGLTSLMMNFDLKQVFNGRMNDSRYFRITVNGQKLTRTFGYDSTTAKYKTFIHDLSAFLPAPFIYVNIEAISNGKWNEAPNANFLDNLMFYEKTGLDLTAKEIFIDSVGFAANDSVRIKITVVNTGKVPNTSFFIRYKIDSTVVSQNVNQQLLVGEEKTFLFTTKMRVPLGNFKLQGIAASSPTEAINVNDTAAANYYGYPTYGIPYKNNFDSIADFVGVSNYPSNWEHGIPAFGTTDSAYSGQKAWDINLTTSYKDNSRAYLYTPFFNTSGVVAPFIGFLQTRNIGEKDGFYIEYSKDGKSWKLLGIFNDLSGKNWYSNANIETHVKPGWNGITSTFDRSFIQSADIGNLKRIQFRFVFVSDKTDVLDGVTIDDFSITLPPKKDAVLMSIASPVLPTNSTPTLTTIVLIKNNGSDTLFSIPISYQVDTAVIATDIWTNRAYPLKGLPPNQTTLYTFPKQFTVPGGDYTLCAYTGLANDEDHFNDTICKTFFGIPVIVPNYIDNFDTINKGWTMGGINSATNGWEYGKTSGLSITQQIQAYSAPNCFKTNLSGNYSANSNTGLYSPYFNFLCADSGLTLSFYARYNMQSAKDGGRVEYTIDNGLTWKVLGYNGDPKGTNWYTHSSLSSSLKPGWSGISNTWKKYSYNLDTFLLAKNLVRFRFVFTSDASGNGSGWVIDDVNVTCRQGFNSKIYDASVYPPAAPAGTPISFKMYVQGLNSKPIDYLTFNYSIDGGAIKKQKVFLNGQLTCKHIITYKFDSTSIVSSGTHIAKIWTSLPNDGLDIERKNDTISFSFKVINNIPILPDSSICFDFDKTTDLENWQLINRVTHSSSYTNMFSIGAPQKSLINATYEGQNCLVTKSSGAYNSNDSSAIISPYYAVDTNGCYYLSFWHFYDTELGLDGVTMEYTLDRGITWKIIDSVNNSDWMNAPAIAAIEGKSGWTGTSNGWILAARTMKILSGSSMAFKFSFGSNSTNQKEGWGIDNFCFEKSSTCTELGFIKNKVYKTVLHQNLPNPSSTATIIPFELAKECNVTMVVSNTLGQTILEFKSKKLHVGSNSITLNTENLSDGIYYYSLIANGEFHTKKLIVSK